MSPPREADRLRFWMKKRGVTRKQIAEATGKTTQAVHWWLKDKNDPPQEAIVAIVGMMGIDLATFYGPLEDDTDAAGEEPDEGDGELGAAASA